MDILRALVACGLLVTVLGEEKKTGKLGHSVKLSCPRPLPNQPKVRWEDVIYNNSPDPVIIFRNENNPDFEINKTHPNRANYKVDRNNFDLKISKLTLGDSGQYSCIVEAGTQSNKIDHYLAIYGPVECSGRTQLLDGENTTLRCNMSYSGEQPFVTWYRGNQALEALDLSDIDPHPIAVKELVHQVNSSDDKKAFRCHLQFVNATDECRLIMNVSYQVRDVEIKNLRDSMMVGEEVTCIAKGNPEPEVFLELPTMTPEKTDVRKKSNIIIPSSWEGKNVTVECTATNTYQGRVKTITKSGTFRVIAATTTTTTTTVKPTTKPGNPEPVNPGISGRASSGKHMICWTTFSLLALLVTLTQLRASFC